jgi:hypothetical protein
LRKKHSFLLTLLAGENHEKTVQGRLEVISTGKTLVFANLEELLSLIDQEMKPDSETNLEKFSNHSQLLPE